MAQGTSGRVRQGFGAGALGTLALTAWEPLRDAVLGHPPVYAVDRLARRGARRWWGWKLSPRIAQRWGLGMRWVYGPTLGALYAWSRPFLPPAALRGGVLLGLAVGAFEWLSFAPLRVTAPPRTWSRAEHGLLVFQVLLFGLVTEAVLSHGKARKSEADIPQDEALNDSARTDHGLDFENSR